MCCIFPWVFDHYSQRHIADAQHLLPHLFQFPTEDHRSEGLSLQHEIAHFEKELRAAIDEVWTKSPVPQVESEASSILQNPALGAAMGTDGMAEGWAKRMREYELNARLDPLDKVQKPDVGKVEWKDGLSRL